MTVRLDTLTGIVCALSVSAFAFSASSATEISVPKFVEDAKHAGLVHEYTGPWEFFVGGGVASFDCDGDRLSDLFIAGGDRTAAMFVNRSKTGGELRFEPKALGLPEADLKHVLGAYPVDIDNDGYRDLVLLRLGENLVLKGGPHCTFGNANASFRFDGGLAWSTGFSAIWEAGNIFPTLAFANYVDRSKPGAPWGTCHDNVLVRPGRDRSRPDYAQKIALAPGHCALSMLFSDWSSAGDLSLRIANDRHYYRGGEEQLWHIAPGTEPRLYAREDGWRSLNIWGMGIAAADLDADGRPEYALTSMGDTKLQMLDAGAGSSRPTYTDIAGRIGTTAHRPYTGGDIKPSTGWHTQFADFNNDGRLDLFIAKGNVEDMPEAAAFDPDNLLLADTAGNFHEFGAEAGIARKTRGRGAAIVDFNADGLLDIVVVNRGSNVSLFRNLGLSGSAPANWLKIRLTGAGHNIDGVGAIIEVTTSQGRQLQTVSVGGGHASGQSGWTHFGLAAAQTATVRVKWPGADWDQPRQFQANQQHILTISRP